MRNSAASFGTKKASPPPLPPPQKVDCYQSFEEFEKRVTKLHLPENWQINSLANYYWILKHDTIHDIPIFDTYIGNNLEFTIRVFAVCIQANHEIYMNFSKSVKNITLSNLVQEIGHYCICEGIKNEKNFQYTNQHSVPKIFNPNVTIPSTFYKILQHGYIFAKPISAPTARNMKIQKKKEKKKIICSKIH